MCPLVSGFAGILDRISRFSVPTRVSVSLFLFLCDVAMCYIPQMSYSYAHFVFLRTFVMGVIFVKDLLFLNFSMTLHVIFNTVFHAR